MRVFPTPAFPTTAVITTAVEPRSRGRIRACSHSKASSRPVKSAMSGGSWRGTAPARIPRPTGVRTGATGQTSGSVLECFAIECHSDAAHRQAKRLLPGADAQPGRVEDPDAQRARSRPSCELVL